MEVFISRGESSVSNKTAALVLVAILTSVSILTMPLHSIRAQAQGPSYTLDGSSEGALGQSTLQCADLGGSWSNSTVTCTVSGQEDIPSGGSLGIDSGATLVISKGAALANSGTIENNGTITNSGTIENNGTITNSGTLTSYGTITNSGTLDNSPSGITINSGTVNNGSGGTVTNSRDFYNSGAIANSGDFTDSCAGELYNTGTFSGNPAVSCGTTSSISQSTSTTTTKSSDTVELGAVFVLAALAIVFLLRRGGIRKT
jgi:hypothetical protein